jgi:hypothetical protein
MEIENIEIEFIDEKSPKGTSLKYIKFNDTTFRLSKEQKETLKIICNGYFFYSKAKQMWGFTDKTDNQQNVLNYIIKGIVPPEIPKLDKINQRNIPNKGSKEFVIEEFLLSDINIKGLDSCPRSIDCEFKGSSINVFYDKTISIEIFLKAISILNLKLATTKKSESVMVQLNRIIEQIKHYDID